jgi:DNA-directed RNA polymerase I subunit RPA49
MSKISKKRKRDESPTRETTIGISSAKPGKGGPYLSECRLDVVMSGLNVVSVSYPAVEAPPTTAFKRYAKKKSKVENPTEVDDGIMLVGETDAVEFITNEEETERASEGGCQYACAFLLSPIHDPDWHPDTLLLCTIAVPAR